jgi:hypothetical protein
MSRHIDAIVGSQSQQVRASAKLIIESTDKRRRILIVQRVDGLFHILEEWLDYDAEEDVTYWTHPMHPLRGVYESVEIAEREARTWPPYRAEESDRGY